MKPDLKAVRPENVAGAMKSPEFKRWITWVWNLPKGADKYTKRPVDPTTGILSSYKDQTKWLTFDAAYEECVESQWSFGLGFVPGDGIFGIDLDSCVGASGIEHPVAKQIVERFATFTELSPSGNGLHIYGLGDMPLGGKVKTIGGQRIECYGSGWLTVTGGRLRRMPTELQDRREAVVEWHEGLFGKAGAPASGAPGSAPTSPAPQNLSPEMLAAFEAHAGEGDENVRSQDEEDEALICTILRSNQGQKFKRLFLDHNLVIDCADGSPRGFDHSQADFKLLCQFPYWTEDEAQMDRLFRASCLFTCCCLDREGKTRPEKWKRLGKKQIKRALEKYRQEREHGN